MSGPGGTVLVTGAAGFIGRRLVERLCDAGCEVVGLLLPGEAVPEAWGDAVRVVRGDVRDAASVERALQGVDTVFHLAALVAEANDDYDAHHAVTAEGSRHVYAAAADAGARVVVTTSICAYGDAIRAGVCSEQTARGLHQGPYGRAKQLQEDHAFEALRERGLAVSIVRPSNVYGAGSVPWVRMLAERIAAGQMAVPGDGSGNAGLVHVANLADALLAIAGTQAAIGRVYNVCDGLDTSWRRYMDDIAAIVGAPPPPAVPFEPLLAAALANEDPAALVGPSDPAIPPLELLNLVGSDNRFDTTRIREEVGWSPAVGYEAGLEEVAGWLAANPPAAGGRS